MDYLELLVLAISILAGIWCLVDPVGILGWAKQAHPAIDVHDPAAQSVAKFIGVSFIIFPFVIFIAMILSRYRPYRDISRIARLRNSLPAFHTVVSDYENHTFAFSFRST